MVEGWPFSCSGITNVAFGHRCDAYNFIRRAGRALEALCRLSRECDDADALPRADGHAVQSPTLPRAQRRRAARTPQGPRPSCSRACRLHSHRPAARSTLSGIGTDAKQGFMHGIDARVSVSLRPVLEPFLSHASPRVSPSSTWSLGTMEPPPRRCCWPERHPSNCSGCRPAEGLFGPLDVHRVRCVREKRRGAPCRVCLRVRAKSFQLGTRDGVPLFTYVRVVTVSLLRSKDYGS